MLLGIWGFDDLKLADKITTALSLIGSIWMIYTCFNVPGPKTITLKFICAIAISDFCYSIANAFSSLQTTNTYLLIKMEATLRQSSFLLSVFFSMCIATITYKSTISDRRFKQTIFYYITIIMAPIICFGMTIILPNFYYHEIRYDYGPLYSSIISIDLCRRKRLMFYMLYEGLPVILGFALTLSYYIRAYKALRRLPKTFLQQMNLRKSKLLWYPSILILSFLPCVVDNILEIMGSIDDKRRGIRLARVLITNSIGLTNAVVYGIQRKLYRIDDPDKYEDMEDDDDVSYYSHMTPRTTSLQSLQSLQSELVRAKHKF